MGWSEKKYRQEIARMKEQISDKEYFLSERYQHLLRKMAAQITKDHFSKVHTYAASESGIRGWYDGKRIGINIANDVTRSFEKKELKNKSLIGYLGHECGHKNCSRMDLRKKYLTGIKDEHRLYPHPPVAESEEEEQSLVELKEAFQEGQPFVILVYYHLAEYVQNFLEDLYVEETMCRDYPGNIRQGILLNRNRWMDLSESIKAQKDESNMDTAVMMNLLVQSALCGSINAWDGQAEPYLEWLESIQPYLERAPYEDDESYRFHATNQILLKMWDFIREDAKRLEDEHKERKEKDEKRQKEQQGEKQDEDSPGNGGQEEKEDASKGKNEDLSTEGFPDAGVQNSNGGLKPDSKEWQEIKQQIGQRLSGYLYVYSNDYQSGKEENGNVSDAGWSGLWETDGNRPQPADGQEKSPYIKYARKEPERAAPADKEEFEKTERELNGYLNRVAKEKVDQQYEEQLYASILLFMDQIDFGQEHRQVTKKLFRSLEIPEDAVAKYKSTEREVQKVMRKLQQRLLPILEMRQTRMESGLPIGRQLDMHHIYRRDGKVFQKRHHPGEETAVAIAYLIDQSGSMAMSSRLEYAKLAALCLYLFGIMADIPVCVYGHHTERLSDGSERVCLHSYAEFGSIDGKDKFRIMGIKPKGANRDGAALRFVGEMLLRRPEKQKLLILSSDGLPNASGYSGDIAEQDLKKIKQELEAEGILFLAAAIGENKKEIQKIYGNAFLDISDIRKFPEKLTKEVLRKIKEG